MAAWFPLWNSIRIAGISTVVVFFAGIFAAYYLARLHRGIKGVLDVVLTLPLVLPPTVVGYLLLWLFGPEHAIGAWSLRVLGLALSQVWYAGIIAAVTVSFPLMYRSARGAFEQFDPDLEACAKTLGLSNHFIFWKIRMPSCLQSILAGVVLSFARALGEYGATNMLAGSIEGKTATISTTVYKLWQSGETKTATVWIGMNLLISLAALLFLNLLERRDA